MALVGSQIGRPTAHSHTISKPSDEQRAQALYTGPFTSAIGRLYGIALLDLETQKIVNITKEADPSGTRTVAEYFFSVPPKMHDMSEPFLTNITHTQAGGKFVESHGVLTRTITLQGTTGIRPNRQVRAATSIPLFGSAIGQIQDTLETLQGGGFLLKDTTIPDGEVTGYDDIIFLRNLFRVYSDRKLDTRAGRVLMLWLNAKDDDFWVVEPQDFKLTADSGSPLSYKYAITLRTLVRFSANVDKVVDPLEEANKVQDFAVRAQEYNRALRNLFEQVATQIRRLEGFGVFGQTQLLSPILNVTKGMTLLKNTSREHGVRLATNAATLTGNLADAAAALVDSGVDVYDPIVRELYRAGAVMNRILREPTVRAAAASGVPDRFARRAEAFASSSVRGNVSVASPQGRRPSDFSVPEVTSVRQEIVFPDETIRTLSRRTTGSESNWEAIVLLNDLISPYISRRRAPGVFGPGDHILIPDNSGTAVTQTSSSSSGSEGPVVASYGVDLQIKSKTNSYGDEESDLVVTSSGDLGLVRGTKNVEQAVLIKFATEVGELPVHTFFGSKLSIGRKAQATAFTEYRLQAERTIMSDNRVSTIKSLNINTNGDTVRIAADIALKDSNSVISTAFDLRV